MKLKNTYDFARMIVSLCLMLTLLVSSSMVALATSVKPVGELIVTGSSSNPVTVNGEAAASGRTVFAASTITTPEGATAVVDLGKAGKLELGPNTTYTLGTDGSLNGSLTAGSAKVLNAASTVGIKTLSGDVVSLNTGDVVTANSTTAKKQDDSDDDEDWLVWILVFGAAATAILLFTLQNDEDGPQTSPVR